MIILEQGDFLRGVASNASSVAAIFYGLVQTPASGALEYKRIDNGVLGGSLATLYTAPTGKTVVISEIVLVNHSSDEQTVRLYAVPSAGSATTANALFYDVNLAPFSTLVWHKGSISRTAEVRPRVTRWHDFGVIGNIGLNTGWTFSGDGLTTPTDSMIAVFPVQFPIGATLKTLRIKYGGSDGSTGIVYILRKRDEGSAGTTFTDVISLTTVLNSGVTITTDAFTPEPIVENFSYELAIISVVPAAQTADLYSFGFEVEEAA